VGADEILKNARKNLRNKTINFDDELTAKQEI
jgi:hypothetical protein